MDGSSPIKSLRDDRLRAEKSILRPTISPFADIDGRRCGDIEAHQAHERNNTAATDIVCHRYRRRRMWVYRGSSGIRTKQHRRHRYRLSPISTAADVGISRLIGYTNAMRGLPRPRTPAAMRLVCSASPRAPRPRPYGLRNDGYGAVA